MGFITPTPPPVDVEEWKTQAAPRADQAARPGLGGQRLRHADRDLPALRRQAGRLLASARSLVISATTPGLGGLGDIGDWWTRADRLPEARRLDAAVGDDRPRLRLDAAHVPLPAADRRDPLLAAARARCGCRRGRTRSRSPRAHGGRSLDVALYAGVLAVGRSTCCSPTARPVAGTRAGRLDPAAIAVLLGLLALLGLRDKVSFLAARAEVYGLPARRLPVPDRELDRRLADRLRLHLVGRRLVEAQPPLPLRRLGDDQQHAVEPLAQGEGAALARPPRGPAARRGAPRSPRTLGTVIEFAPAARPAPLAAAARSARSRWSG